MGAGPRRGWAPPLRVPPHKAGRGQGAEPGLGGVSEPARFSGSRAREPPHEARPLARGGVQGVSSRPSSAP